MLPSLDLSFQISPSPAKLKEFLVRMDAVNKTSSESFQIHQLSSVGHQWEISLLQPVESMLSSELMPGQALSCFFKLEVFLARCISLYSVFFHLLLPWFSSLLSHRLLIIKKDLFLGLTLLNYLFFWLLWHIFTLQTLQCNVQILMLKSCSFPSYICSHFFALRLH